MLASGTEIVSVLGLGDRLISISHECDYPPDVLDRPRGSRPRFDPEGLSSGQLDQAVRHALAEHGSVYEVDAARLEALNPDLILTQAVCEVCAVPAPGVRELTARLGLSAEVLSLDAHTLEDIFASVKQVASAAGVAERGEAVVAALRARVERVHVAVMDAQRPRVLALEWLDPPFSPGHWVPEQIEAAGGECLVGRSGDRSRQISWESLGDLDPDVLVLMPCGYGVPATVADADAAADRLSAVAARAIGLGRAFAVNGSAYFNRSGPRVVRGVEVLAALLHPERFEPPGEDEGTAWRPP